MKESIIDLQFHRTWTNEESINRIICTLYVSLLVFYIGETYSIFLTIWYSSIAKCFRFLRHEAILEGFQQTQPILYVCNLILIRGNVKRSLKNINSILKVCNWKNEWIINDTENVDLLLLYVALYPREWKKPGYYSTSFTLIQAKTPFFDAASCKEQSNVIDGTLITKVHSYRNS